MSNVLKQSSHYLEMQHGVSIVDGHTKNGVEGTNKNILGLLKALVHEGALESELSDPICRLLVLFVMNYKVISDTGFRPTDLMFGSKDGMYL